jgi:aspartate aminotransferase
MAPVDPILGVSEAFKADTNPLKMNVGVGAYRNDDGKPVVLECVREAERRVAGAHNMEYLPIVGDREFVNEALKVAYGDDASCLKDGRTAAIQSLSGTGSCRLIAEFMQRFAPGAKIYIPTPTWSNHHNIWRDAGVEESTFRYYDAATRGLDYAGMMEDVSKAPKGSFFLLHACAHNPTGVDPSAEQWAELSTLMKEKGLFPIFDSAYQGFASGDFVRDGAAVTKFLEDGHQIALSQSFAKNFGMYGQRIGTVSFVCQDAEEASRVESQLKGVARAMYSNPPLHGALLAKTVLSDPALKQQWFEEVKGMADRIISMRTALRSNLEGLGSQHNWQHITDQIGMFCFSGMTPEQCDKITKDWNVYLTRNGRISMAGVTSKNVERLAEAIHTVTK